MILRSIPLEQPCRKETPTSDFPRLRKRKKWERWSQEENLQLFSFHDIVFACPQWNENPPPCYNLQILKANKEPKPVFPSCTRTQEYKYTRIQVDKNTRTQEHSTNVSSLDPCCVDYLQERSIVGLCFLTNRNHDTINLEQEEDAQHYCRTLNPLKLCIAPALHQIEV